MTENDQAEVASDPTTAGPLRRYATVLAAAGLCGAWAVAAAAGGMAWATAARLGALTVELPIVLWLFGAVFHVGRLRTGCWLLFYAATIGVCWHLEGGINAILLVPGHLAMAALICLRAYRDPVLQIRLALIALQDRQTDRAHKAYGRYLMLGRTLDASVWNRLRTQTISDAEPLRPHFAGMVNACRYGDLHGLGDIAYNGLFPESEGRASAEEG